MKYANSPIAPAGFFGDSVLSGNTPARPGTADQTAERFLTLLVAQLNNQDPMNPLDNAQMTSQIAQINTVTGIQQLNQSVQALTGQFAGMQLLQGTSMIGRTVLSEGNALGAGTEEGTCGAAFDLAGPAGDVQVQILDTNGKVIDTIAMGACAAGRNYFAWDASKFAGERTQLHFHVLSDVPVTELSPHVVLAASQAPDGSLQLELDDGTLIGQGAIRAIY